MVAVLLCANCRSHLVDVKGWQSRTVAILRCWACGHEAPIDGFTVGRVYRTDEDSLLSDARVDAASPKKWKR